MDRSCPVISSVSHPRCQSLIESDPRPQSFRYSRHPDLLHGWVAIATAEHSGTLAGLTGARQEPGVPRKSWDALYRGHHYRIRWRCRD